MGYGVWLHGEAVATGTIMAADLSQRMGWLNAAEVQRIKDIMLAAKLPIEAPDFGAEEYLRLMQLDKKVSDGRIRLILQQAIGKAVITADYDADKLQQTLSLAA
jgi:3-dehydroquinate synthetase